MEKSIGKKETFELAVMVDTFSPLMVTENAIKLQVDDYYKSWINK
jgi:homogentisate 1,2-dioxygenase